MWLIGISHNFLFSLILWTIWTVDIFREKWMTREDSPLPWVPLESQWPRPKTTRAAAATSSAPPRPRGESVCSSSRGRIRAKTAWTACRTSWGQWAAVFGFFRVRGRKLPENHGLGGTKWVWNSLNWINLVFDGVIRDHRYWMGLFCEKSGRWWWWLRRRRGGEWWMVGFSYFFGWCVILLLCLD